MRNEAPKKKKKNLSPFFPTSFTPSPTHTHTVIQVASRIWALWGIVNVAPGPCSTGAVHLFKLGPLDLQLNLVTLLFAWCTSEILRYSFYAAKEVGVMPRPLLWLRYSAFIVLYPLGVASEMTMVYLAMPTIKKNRPLSIHMPNAWNFALDYYVACWLGVAAYVPGLPELYLHMCKQRKKVLGGGGGSGAGASGSGRKAKAA